MKDVICIVCPNSCHLQVDPKTNNVIGQLCPRGEAYAIQEITNPKRSITSSVKTIYKEQPLISVRTVSEVNKNLIPMIMQEIKKIVLDKPLPRATVIIENVAGSGVDIITTTTLHKGDSYES